MWMERLFTLLSCVILLVGTAGAQTQPAVSPKATLKALSAAMRDGDRQAITRILQADDELGQEMIESTATLAEATAQLRQAAIAHFGAEGARDLIGHSTGAEEDRRIDSSIETIEGALATIAIGDEAPIELILVDDEWRVPVKSLATGIDPAVLRSRLAQQSALVLVVRQTSDDLQAGRFQSALEARQSLYNQVSAIVEEEAQSRDESATTVPTTQP
jgi:hypothetical protein